MRIHVTEKHIRRGRKRQSGDCPIALALKEATGSRWSVDLTAFRYGSWDDFIQTDFVLPAEAQHFIEAFDEGEPVSPFCFDLPIEEADE